MLQSSSSATDVTKARNDTQTAKNAFLGLFYTQKKFFPLLRHQLNLYDACYLHIDNLATLAAFFNLTPSGAASSTLVGRGKCELFKGRLGNTARVDSLLSVKKCGIVLARVFSDTTHEVTTLEQILSVGYFLFWGKNPPSLVKPDNSSDKWVEKCLGRTRALTSFFTPQKIESQANFFLKVTCWFISFIRSGGDFCLRFPWIFFPFL